MVNLDPYKAMMYLDLPLPLDTNHHQYYYVFSGESVKTVVFSHW